MSSKRSCPVCGAGALEARSFLRANLDRDRLDEFSYASRKTPEYMNLNLVQCQRCDLVYADEPPTQDDLARAYHVADYDSAEEADDAAATYIRAMQPVLQALPRRESALEIGTGTGVLLEHLAQQGFTELVGVEPSAAAIAAAPSHRRAWIREGVFQERDFTPRVVRLDLLLHDDGARCRPESRCTRGLSAASSRWRVRDGYP